MTTLLSDLRTLYHLALAPVRGRGHAQRLESFYARQATSYDAFRARLLHGRDVLYGALPCPTGGVWVDFGGGTGANLEQLGSRLADLRKAYIVDLSPSMLEVARRRVRERCWTNVETVAADATRFAPDDPVDVVTLSYSLTMIPDWFTVIDLALRILRPGGTIGVVDFYVSRKHPAAGHARHTWLTRTFWPTWFGLDNVQLSPDHVPYLQKRFETTHFSEHRGRIPYLPLLRPAYYLFVGRKRAEATPVHEADGSGVPRVGSLSPE